MADEVLSSEPKRREHDKKHRTTRLVALIALTIAVIALLLRGCDTDLNGASPNPVPSICETGEPGPTGATGAQGEPGLSAYELWIAMGNVGTIEEFLTSLIGEPGEPGEDGKVIYYGSDGVTGPIGATGATGSTGATGATGATGDAGKSAYQLWLDAGNTGTPEDFLISLIGPAGAQGPAGANGADGQAGVNGLSAYELWLAIGNEGTEQGFFDSLAGVPGTDGIDGAAGASAYEIWLANGNTGTEGEFLASLVGPQGIEGAPGVCTVGETGDSAYEIWLAAGNVGSEDVFLASLIGPKGDKGDTGEQGPPGAVSLGYYGSFYDTTDQFTITAGVPQPWTYNSAAESNGVTVVSNGNGNSRIKFPAAGVYNIEFSTVFLKTNSSSGEVDIWFRKNGVDIPNSNTRITVAGQAQTVAAWNFFFSCTNPVSDYLEIMWWTNDPNTIHVDTIPAATSPSRPLVPSIILTATQVG